MKQHALNPVPYYSNFHEMLCTLNSKYGSQQAITCYSRRGECFTYSYSGLYQDSMALRNALHAMGLSQKHIAVAGENSYHWLAAYFGIILSGGVAVCIDIEQPDDAVCEMIRQADCCAVFASSSLLPVIQERKESQDLPLFSLEGSAPAAMGIAELCSQDAPGADILLDPDQTAVILYTSGTTVAAKPVMLSHRALLTNVSDALSMISPPPKAFCSMPFYHAYGMTCSALAGLAGGLGICINGNLKTMLRDMTAYQPGCIITVPLIAESIHKMVWADIEKEGKKKQILSLLKRYRLLGRPEFLEKRLHREVSLQRFGNLRLLVCGGAYLSREVADDLTDLGITVLQGYGITECSPLVTVNREPDSKTVGYPLPHVELKLEDGEILVRGSSVMTGYYRRPELTAEAMDGGWFRTGDLGQIDKDGRLTITGRKKNLIVLKNGKKISAEEIEESLSGIDAIREVVAYGAMTGNSADDVKLSIMVYPDPEVTRGMSSYEILNLLQREVDRLNAKLPVYKQIQLINLREQEFEKTSSKKIKRQIM